VPSNVPRSARHFFEEFTEHVEPERTAGKHLTYRFEIRDVGTWRIVLDDGTVEVEEAPGDAAVVVETDEKTFLAIVRREKNPILAYMSGKVKIKGPVGALFELQHIIPEAQ